MSANDSQKGRTEQLTVTEEGTEIPDWLVGHTGEWTLRTPLIKAELNAGNPYPEDYRLPGGPDIADEEDARYPDLAPNMVEISANGRTERYEVVEA